MGELFGWEGVPKSELAAPIKTVQDKWKLVPAFLKVKYLSITCEFIGLCTKIFHMKSRG